MGLKYKLKKAQHILNDLNSHELKSIRQICKEIQNSEEQLSNKGEHIFAKCKNQCKGICCKNIYIDTIISFYDFLFILAIDDKMYDQISKSLEKEALIYSADCIFLENGKGPCIFPCNLMPEICITSFCNYEPQIRKEINLVKRKFLKLSWFTVLTKLIKLKRLI